MEELMRAVSALVDKEYEWAAKAHGGAAASPHEGYALIKEEVEEADQEMERLKLGFLWENVKNDADDVARRNFEDMKSMAIAGACELIQVAAMADKGIKGIRRGSGEKC
mgnify:FL=1